MSDEPEGNGRGSMSRFYGLLQIAPTLISAAAGIYLLQTSGAGGESSWFEVIAHGMGIYFIAKAFYMGRSLALQRQIRDATSFQAYSKE